ncbi:glycine betaine ABC transporter substrate-binding protein, partial [Ralstonia pseudosolanacearum]|uniref:glycine betaine ABC transporter substrate-binding protein n=1 Tax=Ralstonia pseudosolanacearum TaxID=1310165 RepID=UPI003D1841A7
MARQPFRPDGVPGLRQERGNLSDRLAGAAAFGQAGGGHGTCVRRIALAHGQGILLDILGHAHHARSHRPGADRRPDRLARRTRRLGPDRPPRTLDTRRLIRNPFLRRLLAWMALGWLACGTLAWAEAPLRIGSKRFTEAYVLGEVLTQAAAPHGPAEHVPGLGNTAIVFAALRSGSIDLYPDYLGTIAAEILHLPPAQAANPDQAALLADVNRALAPL